MIRQNNFWIFLSKHAFLGTFFLAFFLTGCGDKPDSGKSVSTEVPAKNEASTTQVATPPAGQAENPPKTVSEKKIAENQKNETVAPAVADTPEKTESLAVLASADQELNRALTDFMKEFQDDPLPPHLEDPAKAVFYFIKALQLKNDKVILALLSTPAREEWRKYQIPLGPDNCASMNVEFGNIIPIQDKDGNEIGTQVGTLWTLGDPEDPDEKVAAGDQIAWIVRKENVGEWRIAGMAAILGEDYPPLLFNFENMEEMQYFQENIDEEVNSRLNAKEKLEAESRPGVGERNLPGKTENPENSTLPVSLDD